MSKTQKPTVPDLFQSLDDIYSQIPETKCMGCPGCGGRESMKVEAECCKRGVPPAYQIEFFNMLQATAGWPDEEKEKLLLNCIETLKNPSPDKACVFLGEDNRCRIYSHRPINCRIYGLLGGREDKGRAKTWLMELFSSEFNNSADASYYFDKILKDFDPEKINAAIKKDLGAERPSGFVNQECQNVDIDPAYAGVSFDVNKLWSELEKLESTLAQSDVTQDPDRQSLMAFHVALLLHSFGMDYVEKIMNERNKSQ